MHVQLSSYKQNRFLSCRNRYHVHTIRLIHKLMEDNVGDVDEDCYSFLDLFDYAMKVFDIEAGQVLSFQDKKGYFIENDKDILTMFERFSTELVIPISVAVVGGPIAIMPPVVEVGDDVESIPEEEFVSRAEEVDDDVAFTPPNPETLSITNSEDETEQHEGVQEAETQPHPEPHIERPEPQSQPGSQSQSKKKKSTNKRLEKDGKSSRYRLRKNQKDADDDFVVSDEEYGHSEDKDFDVSIEEDLSESDCSKSDEHELGNELINSSLNVLKIALKMKKSVIVRKKKRGIQEIQ